MAACAAALCGAQELPPEAAAKLREAGIPPESVGVLVRRVADGATLVSHNADASLQPASTLKLLTSLVALETLGPAWRGRSEMRITGVARDGALRGNVILRGLADVDFDWRELERMLQALRATGVREIHGDFVLDLSHFRPARTDVGVGAFDDTPEFRYNVIPDSLSLGMYLLRLEMASDGESLRVLSSPPLENVVVDAGMRLIERNCASWEDGWVIPEVERTPKGVVKVRLRGDFPRHCSASTAISVIDRVVYADRLFRALWRRLGGTFHGKTREGVAPPESRLLAEHRSRALSELVHDVNKRSDNPVTRVVFLALGAGSDGAADETTARRADAQVRAWLERRGIDGAGLVLENGSGLSRLEKTTALQLAGVLQAALASEWAPEFLASLPIVALDGGMRTRLRGSAAAVRSRIKTGTLRDATAVAGYVKDDAGTNHIVVAIVNHALARKQVARPIVDAVIDWVASGAGRSKPGG